MARAWPGIAFGTERFPEKVARRLRAVNITCWIAAPVAAVFALLQALDDWGRLAPLVAINAADAVVWASIPLLHRFGAVAAPLALAGTVYASSFALTALLGTAAGIHLHYITAAALSVLFFGVDRIFISAVVVMTGGILFVAVSFGLPADTGLVPKAILRANFAVSAATTIAILFALVLYALREIGRAEAALEREYARSESLLANILPPAVAARLKENKAAVIADSYAEASILFADMAGFTARASTMPPADLVQFLNRAFSEFDRLVERYGLEKIKTTGDAYMVVSGVPQPRPDHAEALARLALDMLAAAQRVGDGAGRALALRIGIASGPVVAGVVGTKKFFYDVWGDTVNIASRMESTGEPGRIQVSEETRLRLGDKFALEPRGEIEVRGKGRMRTWFLTAPQPAPSPSPPP
ncbi:MAG: adenylate/guanylate cyclase domain-containing protein [Rhodospirillaceae bacterium]|nr:adenylate/guanylate cyclase domain-containing protein [Rhodospirillaceae bacterium]